MIRKLLLLVVALIVVVIVISAVTASGGDSGGGDSPSSQVTYEVTTDAGSIENVTYTTWNHGNFGEEQANGTTSPFTKTVAGDSGFFSTASVTAQAGEGANSITCRIKDDSGKVISEQTSTGQYAVVSCTG